MNQPALNLNCEHPTLTHNQFDSLSRVVTMEEVKRAVFEMSHLKAPGPDGMHALFYQDNWPVVALTMFALVRDAFATGSFHAILN